MASALLESSAATAGAPQTGVGTRAVSRRQVRHHKCAYCPKGFKRSEHRLRHERTHTHEKPFSCRHCNKSYSRKDLVVRHERTLHAQEHNDEQSTGGSLSSPASTQYRSPCQNDDSVRPEQPLQNEQREPRSNTPSPNFDEPSTDGLSTINIPDQFFMTPLGDKVSENMCSTSHDNLILPPGSDISTYLGDLNDFMFDGEDLAMYDTSTTTYSTAGYLQQISAAKDIPEVYPNVHPRRGSAVLSTTTTKFVPTPTSPHTPRTEIRSHNAPESVFTTDTSQHHQIPASLMGHGDTPSFLDGAFDRSCHDAAQRNDRPRDPSDLTRVAEKPPRGLPHLRQSTPRSAPHLKFDEHLYAALSKDLACRLNSTDDLLEQLPHASLCHAFLNSYIQCFDLHFPMVHWPTLDVKSTPSPLIFSMCSIGALYRLDHRRARVLYDLSLRALSTTFPCMQTHESFQKHEPIWAVQAKILLSMFSMLSGEEDLTSASMNEHAFYTLVYGKQRQSLSENTHSSTLSWADWAKRETWKRLLGVIYISSTLYMIIYGINPGFNATTDLDYEVFDEEDLWNSATASEWLELRAQRGAASGSIQSTMKDVLQCILSDNTKGQPEQAHVWPFAMLVLTHGVVVHTWQIFQVMQTCTQGASSPDESTTFASRILDLATTSLSRCKTLLVGNQKSDQDFPDESQVTCPLFASRSVLRVAYTQLFKTAVNFNRFNLYAQDPVTIEAQLSLFASEPIRMKRSPQLVDVLRNMLEGMSIPVRMGYMLVRKTACFRWSVEHAAVNWDTALFITKWVHCMEMDVLRNLEISSTECALLTEVREILFETDIDIDHTQSLAAGLARTWAWFLRDVWVWGITPRLGAVLDQLACAYERFHKSCRTLPVGSNK